MYSFWNKNKAALILSAAGVAKSLLDNYWIFTNLPLATESTSDPTAKFFYILGQAVVGSIQWGGVGYGIDLLRGIAAERIEPVTTQKNYQSIQLSSSS